MQKKNSWGLAKISHTCKLINYTESLFYFHPICKSIFNKKNCKFKELIYARNIFLRKKTEAKFVIVPWVMLKTRNRVIVEVKLNLHFLPLELII